MNCRKHKSKIYIILDFGVLLLCFSECIRSSSKQAVSCDESFDDLILESECCVPRSVKETLCSVSHQHINVP